LFETCFGLPHDLDSFENVIFFHLYTLVKKITIKPPFGKICVLRVPSIKQSQIQDLSFLGEMQLKIPMVNLHHKLRLFGIRSVPTGLVTANPSSHAE